jgi:cysteinyl-tRNA synthetase
VALRLYNTFSKREEDFQPQKAGVVTMYTCGPTVYGRPHIGNYASFLMADLLRRWLEAGHRLTVKHVKNITDVGHLVADQDEGEDKVEREALKEKVDPLEIAKRYTAQYLDDERALRMLEPAARPKATEYIPQMIEIIEALVKKGNAYEMDDGVYFAVETFPAYGALSGNTLAKLEQGARVSVDEHKRHPADFALWKKCVGANAKHILRWPSPWGEGFPGWHIECSAMSGALLGQQIDIHTGGQDNIFPHHECEIAQSESAFSKHPFVRYWLHRRRIELGTQKMSKSLGNVLTISSIIERGYSPLDLRYYFLSVHYRTNLKFAWKGMDDARKVRLKILDWMDEVAKFSATAAPSPQGTTRRMAENVRERFVADMDSDLNTPAALSEVFGLMNEFYAAQTKKQPLYREDIREIQECIDIIRHTFGCFEREDTVVPLPVLQLVEARAAARERKDFAESDRLRDEARKLGFEIRDATDGQKVKKL